MLLSMRLIVGALLVAPLSALAVFVWALPPLEALAILRIPAIVLGLAGPAVGFNVYQRMLRAGTPDDTAAARFRRYQSAVITALAITEGAGLFSIMAYSGSRDLLALVGLISHVASCLYLWPRATE